MLLDLFVTFVLIMVICAVPALVAYGAVKFMVWLFRDVLGGDSK